MIRKELPLDVEDFAALREKNLCYVDKTGLIGDLIEDSSHVILLTRPRRFGKSLNMSMLRWFFEIPEESLGERTDDLPEGVTPKEYVRQLFDGLAVMDQPQYAAQLGQYPVISISLKSVESRDFESACDAFRAVIAQEAERFSFLQNSERLSENDRIDLSRLTARDPSGKSGKRRFSMAMDDLIWSLHTLTVLLQKHYGRRVLLLIDEYDVPLDKAHLHGYYDEMVSLLRGMFNAVFKTNPALEAAVLTGCLRISGESIFTGINNLNVYMITVTSTVLILS